MESVSFNSHAGRDRSATSGIYPFKKENNSPRRESRREHVTLDHPPKRRALGDEKSAEFRRISKVEVDK